MSMKATVDIQANGVIVVDMEGGLDYEHSMPLREKLTGLAKTYPQSHITLNFQRVDFVGSSGISTFVETMRILDREFHLYGENGRIKISNLKREFIKVFKLYKVKELKTWMEDFEALTAEERAFFEDGLDSSPSSFDN